MPSPILSKIIIQLNPSVYKKKWCLFFIILFLAQESMGAIRVLSLAPSITEMLVFLNVEKKTKDKSLNIIEWDQDICNPNIEAIIQMRPDYVCASPLTSQKVLNTLSAQGIQTVVLHQHSLKDIEQNLHTLASILGIPNVSFSIQYNIPNGLKMLILLGAYRPITCGHHTFMGDCINAIGATNIAKKNGGHWQLLDVEYILNESPHIIWIVADNPSILDTYQKDPIWSFILAKAKEVKVIPTHPICIPGPSLLKQIPLWQKGLFNLNF